MFKKVMIGCLGLLCCNVYASESAMSRDNIKNMVLKETLVVLYKQAMDALNCAQTYEDLVGAMGVFVARVQQFGIARVSFTGVAGLEPRFNPAFEERGTCAWRYLLHAQAMRSEKMMLDQRHAQESVDYDVFSRY